MELSYRLIHLPNKNLFAKCDPDWYDLLIDRTWHASWAESTKTFYARTNRRRSAEDLAMFSTATILMHKLVMGVFGKQQVDHWNGDTLDNRTDNLRKASHAQNMHNRKMDWDNKCGFKGVAPKRHCQTGEYNGRYSATLRVDGKIEHIGYFGSPEYAARAFDIRAIQTRGEFARLNFPLSEYQNISLNDWLTMLKQS